MTSQSPRIYIYKITFEEVPYYYYGVHKEKVFDEEYWGTPVTHKWCWELYTPKKQILEIFDYTDEGWLEAQEVEKRLIRPFYNTDKWCLNENCGGILSLEMYSNGGKIGGKINGKKAKELGLGIHKLTLEQLSENGKKGGEKIKELGVGVHGRTKKQMDEDARKGGKKSKELGVGVHGRTKKQMSEDGRKGGKIGGKIGGKLGSKITNSQKWMCLETGYISTFGPLTIYQRARGIDTSKRKRIV